MAIYSFSTESYGTVHLFVLRLFYVMAENWLLLFGVLAAALLNYINMFFVFVIASAAYIIFMAWPNLSTESFISNISNALGDITLSSVLLSDDAFRVYAMLAVISFCDVVNLAYWRVKEGDEQ